MEKVEGYRLSELVATYRQRVELPSYILAVDWFEQAFRALAAIHATGRKYCSIGPDKVFIGADDSVRIDPAVGTNDFAGGDAAFTPPELLAGRAVDQRADLYGLGAVFYELLTLRCPGPLPDPPSSINITVPKGFDALMLRLLAAAPEDRYASAEEVLADLTALRRAPIRDPHPFLPRRRPRPFVRLAFLAPPWSPPAPSSARSVERLPARC